MDASKEALPAGGAEVYVHRSVGRSAAGEDLLPLRTRLKRTNMFIITLQWNKLQNKLIVCIQMREKPGKCRVHAQAVQPAQVYRQCMCSIIFPETEYCGNICILYSFCNILYICCLNYMFISSLYAQMYKKLPSVTTSECRAPGVCGGGGNNGERRK